MVWSEIFQPRRERVGFVARRIRGELLQARGRWRCWASRAKGACAMAASREFVVLVQFVRSLEKGGRMVCYCTFFLL